MSDDWLAALDEEPDEVTLANDAKSTELDHVRQIDRRLEQGVDEILDGAMKFADIAIGEKECPQEWVDAYGEEEAHKMFRLAQMAQMSAKDAPVGLKLAKELKVGMMAARAKEKHRPQTLNVALVKMAAPVPEFPVVEVQGDDD